jgi:hypothetical protein
MVALLLFYVLEVHDANLSEESGLIVSGILET